MIDNNSRIISAKEIKPDHSTPLKDCLAAACRKLMGDDPKNPGFRNQGQLSFVINSKTAINISKTKEISAWMGCSRFATQQLSGEVENKNVTYGLTTTLYGIDTVVSDSADLEDGSGLLLIGTLEDHSNPGILLKDLI